MNELPSNSNTPRQPQEEEKRATKIVTGAVTRQKKGPGKKFAELFVASEGRSVGTYIVMDIIVPAIKDIIADVVSQGVERMLFGEARSTSRRTGRPPQSQTHVNYRQYSSSSSPPWKRDEPRHQAPVRRRHNALDFENVVLSTRAEAEGIISQMFEIISKYEQVSVADLNEMLGEASSFTDEKWGWTDIRGAGVTRITGGYLLDLTRPEPLD